MVQVVQYVPEFSREGYDCYFCRQSNVLGRLLIPVVLYNFNIVVGGSHWGNMKVVTCCSD